MYDFEALVGELLQSRPELDRAELTRRIEEKKRTVGAGYLTDQGALFLVAGELGVSLRKEELSADMAVKDLYIGANDVTVVARVLAVYPEASFNRKDGGSGKYRRLVLFDGNQMVRMTAWDEKSDEIGKAGLEVGSMVRIVSAYVKQGLDGKPNLNLGKRGRVEVIDDEKISEKLLPISAVTYKMGKLNQEKQFVAVESVVTIEPRYSEFTRADGSGGSLFQFGVAGEGGSGESRVVIWSPSAQPELKRGQRVVVTNVKSRRSNSGEFEIHGDAGSVVIIGPRAERIEFRIVAIAPGRGSRVFLASDKDKNVKILELGPEIKEPNLGDLVGVSADPSTEGRLICKDRDSLVILDEGQFPQVGDLVTKLRDVRTDNSLVMVEVIALSHGSVDDVRLKDGTTEKKGELVIGDDTAEMKLDAWRNLSSTLAEIQPGERLRVVGATVKATRIGSRVLQMSNFTALERL